MFFFFPLEYKQTQNSKTRNKIWILEPVFQSSLKSPLPFEPYLTVLLSHAELLPVTGTCCMPFHLCVLDLLFIFVYWNPIHLLNCSSTGTSFMKL